MTSLAAGTRLGPYEILDIIGAGGMGEVYRARDTRLDRIVAIKVSQQQFSDRFEREARAVAALNHPNICTLYDVGPNYLVMEFIDGKPLNRFIPSGGMRLSDALKIAVRVADALSAAHAVSIVHRDLKPSNVMVTESGVVKLLDFGLAAIDSSAVTSTESMATRTVASGPRTVEGTIVGTFSYMSPEQAEGRKLDSRSDIFSFGSVFYEMLTGKRAFHGETTISTLAAILNQEPKSIAEIVALPPEVQGIVTRCLRKDPDRRFQHASDLRVELQELLDAQSATKAAAAPARVAAPPRRVAWWPAVAVATLIAGAAAGWILHRPPPFRGPQVTRMTYDSGLTCDPALSPDGKLLAYASDRGVSEKLDIWVQPAAGGDPVQLTHDEADDSEPSFSPDGTQIVYRSERQGGGIYVVPTLGGEPRLVAREGRNPRFSPDGAQIAYWTGKGGRTERFARQGGRLFVVPAAGGEPRQLAAKISHASTPAWSPDGRALLFVGLLKRGYTWFLTPATEDRPVEVETGQLPLFANGQAPTPSHWLPDGHVIFAARTGSSANLYRIRLGAAKPKLDGPAERLTFGGGIEDSPSVANGKAAVADLTWNFGLWSLPVDTRAARVTGEPVRLTDSLTVEAVPSLSDDGRKMAYSSTRGSQLSIWVRDFGTGKSVRVRSMDTSKFVTTGSYDGSPVISHDGMTVGYAELKGDIHQLYVVPSSGGLPKRLSEEDLGGLVSITPSGGMVHYGPTPRRVRQIGLLDPKAGVNRILLETTAPTYQVSFSPDERWITFIRLNSPQTSVIYVAPVTGAWPILEKEWIALTDGTQWDDKPRWAPDGNLLYFTSERDGYRCIWVQRLDPRTRQAAGAPFALYHSHSSRRSMLNVTLSGLEMALGRDKIVFVQGEVTGNIWMAQFQ